METEKHCVLNFSLAEVKEALIEKLQTKQMEYPPGSVQSQIKFSMSDTGATMEWTQTFETNF